MTFATIAARTSTADGAGATSHAIGLGSPSAGDLLVVVCASAGAGGEYVINTEASGLGWTPLFQAVGPTTMRMAAFAKVAEGSDALTVLTVNSVRMASLCYRFTGHGSSVAFAASASGTSTNGNPAAATVSGSAQDIVFLSALVSASSVASAAPSGYGTLTTSSAGTAFLSVAERNLNGTTDNPGAFTNSSQEWIAMTLAIPELAIATSARISQQTVEALSGVNAIARLSQFSVETLSSVTAGMRLSQFCVEMLSENVPDDVVGSNANKYRQIQIAC